mgnify:CR=1 FL=1
MYVSPNEMRQVVRNGFQRHCTRVIFEEDVEECVRVEDGRVLAYCYYMDHLFAMWMVDIGLVQFYDDGGAMLQTLDLSVPAHQTRRAA